MQYHTILINSYSHQVGDDKRATGGVHLVQVAKSAHGWRTRVVDSNGRYESAGPSETASEPQVLELIQRAHKRAENDELHGIARRGFAQRERASLHSALGMGLVPA